MPLTVHRHGAETEIHGRPSFMGQVDHDLLDRIAAYLWAGFWLPLAATPLLPHGGGITLANWLLLLVPLLPFVAVTAMLGFHAGGRYRISVVLALLVTAVVAVESDLSGAISPLTLLIVLLCVLEAGYALWRILLGGVG